MTTTSTLARPRAAAAAVGRVHLPALDGIRALAVTLVVAYHAFPGALPGGFVGVDVFFVLSGFLITGLLLRERDETGRVDLRRFWVRRVRRLLPALLLMLLVVSAATLMVGRGTATDLRSQLLGALTWTSNWVQIEQGWSYADAHLPPLYNHLWSLGIEEQFYVLWPLVLIGSLALLGRRRTAAVTTALAAGSFGLMAMWWSADGPDRAYLGLDSHAGGLLIGAGLALAAGRLRPWVDAAPRRPLVLAALGGAAIGVFAAAVAWGSEVTFLGGLAVASVASGALVLAALVPSPVARGLAVAPLRWVGERSYGIYLWHWPLIVMAVRLGPADHPQTAATVGVALAVVASAWSYRWVEVPVRRDGVRATLRRGGAALRCSDAPWPRLVATVGVLALLLGGASVGQSADESDVEASLRAGEAVVASSVEALEDAEPPPPPPPVCRAVPPEAPVSAFGDSVTVAVAPALMERRPGSSAVAVVGWQYTDVASAVRQAAAAGQLQPTVVIATGTNGVVDHADLDALVGGELADRRVALVTPSVPGRTWNDQALAAIHAVAAAHENAVLVDWAATAAQRPDLTAADRVHPNAAGQPALVDLVGQTLATC